MKGDPSSWTFKALSLQYTSRMKMVITGRLEVPSPDLDSVYVDSSWQVSLYERYPDTGKISQLEILIFESITKQILLYCMWSNPDESYRLLYVTSFQSIINESSWRYVTSILFSYLLIVNVIYLRWTNRTPKIYRYYNSYKSFLTIHPQIVISIRYWSNYIELVVKSLTVDMYVLGMLSGIGVKFWRK